MKTLVVGILSILVTLLVAVAFATAMPDYEVVVSSVTGKCKSVTFKGKVDQDGCQKVVKGKITRYSTVQGH
jgi:hypothetical protein